MTDIREGSIPVGTWDSISFTASVPVEYIAGKDEVETVRLAVIEQISTRFSRGTIRVNPAVFIPGSIDKLAIGLSVEFISRYTFII